MKLSGTQPAECSLCVPGNASAFSWSQELERGIKFYLKEKLPRMERHSEKIYMDESRP